jgi:hypothetical protein
MMRSVDFVDEGYRHRDLEVRRAGGSDEASRAVAECPNELREQGASVYSAMRDRKFHNESWGDAPATQMTVGYLVIVPADRQLTQLYIPRRAKLG